MFLAADAGWRETYVSLQDLILFPGEATLVKVDQSAWGRTYVLKFSSSNQRHFVSRMILVHFRILTEDSFGCR